LQFFFAPGKSESLLLRTLSLNCLAGPLKGQIFRLTGGPVFIFGRYPKSTFSLAADPAASHLHFLVDTSENRVRIVDLGSTNGLVINDRHMSGKQGTPFKDFSLLQSGDTILAGASLFRLAVVDDGAVFDPVRAEPDKPVPDIRLHEAGATRVTSIAPHYDDHPKQENGLPAIDGYTLLEKIAVGGKGIVFKAIKDDSGAATAIKMLNFQRNRKQRSIEMFRREIIITKQLLHNHIIRYLGDGASAGQPYLAIEYVDGGSMDELIDSMPGKRLDMPQAVPLFLQLLEAVGYMHDLSLVHRDIKPKNILLDLRRGGSLAVKLSDMGLSCRFSSPDNSEFLPIVTEGGTPAYMPPEQLTNLTRALPDSDVFSAAATFYHLLTGQLLYDFKDHDQTEVILEGTIRPIRELRPDLPVRVAEVITKALSYAPESRYANALEMLDAFRSALA
jgi:hypothetical protein